MQDKLQNLLLKKQLFFKRQAAGFLAVPAFYRFLPFIDSCCLLIPAVC